MKKCGFLLLGFAVIVIIFWSRESATKEQVMSKKVAAQVVPCQSVLPPSDTSLGQQSSVGAGSIPQNSLGDTLALIRMQLVQLSETAIADKEREDQLMIGLVSILTDANAAVITRALSTDELHSRFGLAALQRWLQVDASAAADWVAARTDSIAEQAAVVARELVNDPVALENYCSRLPENDGWQQVFLEQAAQASIRRDPIQALRFTQRMNSGSARLDLMQKTACSWMNTDPAAASEWIGNIKDPLLREELVSIGAKTLAGVDPIKAIEWQLSLIPVASDNSELLFDDTIQDIVGTWVERAPAQAAEAVAQLPEGNLRESTVTLVARHWLQRDPVVAADWIKTLPERDRLQANHGAGPL